MKLNAESKPRRYLAGLGTILMVDLILFLWVVHKDYFSSLGLADYGWIIWDFASLWAGRIVTIIGALTPVIIALARRKKSQRLQHRNAATKDKFSAERIALYLLFKAPAKIGRSKIILPAGLAFTLLAPFLVYLIVKPTSSFPAPASAVAVSKDGSEIYVAVENLGQVWVCDTETGNKTLARIDVGGRPHRIVVGRDGTIFVANAGTDSVNILDPKTHTEVTTIPISPLQSINSIVVGPDERKLFVTAMTGTAKGVIRVIDLDKDKGYPQHSIAGMNCPEGLGISPDGRKLYVATQCGAGLDPVFVINTETEKITTVKSVGGFAVGLDLAIAQKGGRVYVARGGFDQADPKGAITHVPPQLSVIDAGNDEELPGETQVLKGRTLNSAPGPFAVTPDGKYLLAGIDNSIVIINTETYNMNRINLNNPPVGIAVSQGEAGLQCFVWRPDAPVGYQVFLTGLGGLLP